MRPINSRVIVNTPGVPRPLSEQSRKVSTVPVTALAATTTAIHIGGPNVRARAGEANGLPMSGGTRPDSATFDNVDLFDFYIDAITASEGCSYLALE